MFKLRPFPPEADPPNVYTKQTKITKGAGHSDTDGGVWPSVRIKPVNLNPRKRLESLSTEPLLTLVPYV
jgi:hypothetical protein